MHHLVYRHDAGTGFIRFMMPFPWRTAVVWSLLLHVGFFCLFVVVSGQKRSRSESDYISVELITPAGRGERASGVSIHRSTSSQAEPQPKPAAHREQIADDITGAVDKIPDASKNAPSQTQSMSAASGPVQQSPGNGNGYLPYHAVSRLPFFKVQKKPLYPPSERAAGVEARVVVEVYISEQGAVDDVKLIKSGGAQFDQAVMNAARNSSFEPAHLNGRPVPVRLQIPYSFKLR